MGIIARILSVVKTSKNGANVYEIKSDPGGNFPVTGWLFGSAGDDAPPLPGDKVLKVPTEKSRRMAAVGVIDERNAQATGLGGRRIYARNLEGEQVSELHLRNDGTISLSLNNGTFALEVTAAGACTITASGGINLNSATIGTDGAIESPSSVSAPSIRANGKELAEHTHPSGDPNTGPNN